RFSWCDRALVLPNHDEDHESQTQGRPLDVVFGYDPTPISSVTPVWLRRSTPCVFVVHIRPQPVNDTRVVRSPARTLGSAVDGSFFPPFPAEVFHRFPQKRNFPVGVSQPFLHPPSQDRTAASIASFSRRWSHRERPGSFVPAPL